MQTFKQAWADDKKDFERKLAKKNEEFNDMKLRLEKQILELSKYQFSLYEVDFSVNVSFPPKISLLFVAFRCKVSIVRRISCTAGQTHSGDFGAKEKSG